MASWNGIFHQHARGSRAIGLGVTLALAGVGLVAPSGCTLDVAGASAGGSSATTSATTSTTGTSTSASTSTSTGTGGCGQSSACDDENVCTDDVCTAGVCSNPANDTLKPVDDGMVCTDEVCLNGVAGHPLKANGALCVASGTLTCNGVSETCPTCNVDGDCGAPTFDDCTFPTCSKAKCGTKNTEGMMSATQTQDDCKVNLCTSGKSVVTVDTGDKPVDDGNPCTQNTCDALGNPYPYAVVGTDCSPAGQCNNVGVCKSAPGTSCAANAECSSGVCTGGLCRVQTGGSCTDDLVCASGLCSGGKCADCTLDTDCLSTMCNAPTCKAPAGAPCGADTECAGNKCQYGLCLLDINAACTTGAECVSGFCKNSSCKACGGNPDCPVGSTCGTSPSLAFSYCLLPKTAYCDSDAASVIKCNSPMCSGFPAKCK